MPVILNSGAVPSAEGFGLSPWATMAKPNNDNNNILKSLPKEHSKGRSQNLEAQTSAIFYQLQAHKYRDSSSKSFPRCSSKGNMGRFLIRPFASPNSARKPEVNLHSRPQYNFSFVGSYTMLHLRQNLNKSPKQLWVCDSAAAGIFCAPCG